ncbi:hypothetical protein Sjap_014221 [Stephania japonica]|uniref:Uncharacterized protein n=1 Tax=Stephania japonica TaxID=461633 RepID=A0AAP0IZJ5_9MAGN
MSISANELVQGKFFICGYSYRSVSIVSRFVYVKLVSSSSSSSSSSAENNVDDAGSDSESNSDDALDNHYQPIPAQDLNDEEENDYIESNGSSAGAFQNPNNNGHGHHIEEEEVRGDDDSEEEIAVSEAISRAFSEDDRRRTAPLTPEAATRIRDAMRGVSFGGTPPDWAHSVPEDRWIDQLRRLRTPN